MDERLEKGRAVLFQEAKALAQVAQSLDDAFVHAVQAIADCRGRVIVTGVGKAGIIGQKISSTLASVGTPSIWIHPVEALHGDLGRVLAEDIILAFSYSGETEVVHLIESLKRLGTPIIAVTGNSDSRLAHRSEIVIVLGPILEVRPLGLVPSCSTTAMLAVGDAIALTLFEMQDDPKACYAARHPAGELGRILHVEEIMRRGLRNPVASQDVPVHEVLDAMSTEGSPGAVSLVNDEGKLAGFFTDGDLRRALSKYGTAVLRRPVRQVMTANPQTIRMDASAEEALHLMRACEIDNLPVVDAAGVPVGILDLQDLRRQE